MVKIGDITEKVPIVTLSTKSADVNSFFETDSELEGIVVSKNDIPVGVVMKTQFYRRLSTKYGFDVFMGRPIELVMDSNPLIVDYFESITKASSLAMTRKQEHLYDYVIVTMNDRLYGIVSIKTLLTKLAEEQVSVATYTNPLSGLPGNVLIEEKIQALLSNDKPFSMLYVDLDHFKEYNDTYGFKKGDLLIKETANLLNKYVLLNDHEDSFIGHIGGDDFIAILPHYHYDEVCQLFIKEFTKRIKQFYDMEDWTNGHIVTKGRNQIIVKSLLYPFQLLL